VPWHLFWHLEHVALDARLPARVFRPISRGVRVPSFDHESREQLERDSVFEHDGLRLKLAGFPEGYKAVVLVKLPETAPIVAG